MRWAHRTAVLALLATAAGTLVTATLPGTAYAEEVYLRPADGIFRVDGHGWGHGRGLSQWGAQGAATHGVSATTIVETYYPGTTALTMADAPMRVLIQEDEGKDTQVQAVANLAVRDIATAARYVLPSGPTKWRATVDAAGLHLQHLTGGAWVGWSTGGKATWAGPLQFEGVSTVRVYFANGSARDYRGVVRAVKTGETTLATVNSLSMEQYLQGVVPRESPASWHPEALKAQSIAARSYSGYKRAHVPASAQWDICSTIQCQVYGGMKLTNADGSVVNLESASTNEAIAATRGMVRAYGGGPIFAEFSSSNGGHSTAHSTFPYLSAKADPWDAIASPHHDWAGQVTAAQIEARYPSVGTLTRIRITERDGGGEWGGRVKAVVLEGLKNGVPTSVDASGGGIVLANQWPGSSNGLRGSWFKIRSVLDGRVISKSPDPTITRPPADPTRLMTVVMRNAGMSSWSTTGLHLSVASPAGSADPLTSHSTQPGQFMGNKTRPGATDIAPGEDAEFQLAFDVTAVNAGTYKPEYRLRIGSGTPFGDTVTWTVVVQNAVYTAIRAGTRPGPGTPETGTDGGPPPVQPNGGTILQRNGSVTVRLLFKNTGTIAWPVGGDVKLATAEPRNRNSLSAGPGWLSPSRPAALGGVLGVDGATQVAPGQIGYFDFTVHGNGATAGETSEIFEPVWENRSWITGAATRLYVIRTDPNPSRHAVLFGAPPATQSLPKFPGSTGSLLVRLRNAGRDPWPVGQDRLGTQNPANHPDPMRTSAWLSEARPGTLRRNVSRPGVSAVYPGEVGEWFVPLSVGSSPVGTYTKSFRALVEGVTWYGPVVSGVVHVRTGNFGASISRVVSSALAVPSAGTGQAYFDLKNTGDLSWPVGGAVRSASRTSGGSPARAAGWLSASRPGPLTSNLTRPGATTVEPGEVARFLFPLAGNSRAPGRYSEDFGMLWEGWRWAAPVVRITYSIR